MATTVVLTGVTIDGSGKVFIRFEGGTVIEFQSLGAVEEWVSEIDDPGGEGVDNARRMCVAYLKKRSSDLSNTNSVADKNFILDLGHANVVRVQ